MRELLLVDDNGTLLRVMGRSLSAYYRVTTFSHPRDAVNFMEANSANLDVIICDFRMPGLSGLELLQKATAIKNDTVRVLLTGHTADELFENMSEYCDAILDKNICKNIRDIVALVEKITVQKQEVENPA